MGHVAHEAECLPGFKNCEERSSTSQTEELRSRWMQMDGLWKVRPDTLCYQQQQRTDSGDETAGQLEGRHCFLLACVSWAGLSTTVASLPCLCPCSPPGGPSWPVSCLCSFYIQLLLPVCPRLPFGNPCSMPQ